MQNLDAGKRKCWRLSAIILSLISAVLLSYVLLVGSILAVVYLTPGYFEKEYEKYDVLSSLPEMTMSEEDGLMAVTKHMKHFLLHGQQLEYCIQQAVKADSNLYYEFHAAIISLPHLFS